MITYVTAALLFCLFFSFLAAGLLLGRKCMGPSCSQREKLVTRDGEVLACPKCEKEYWERKKRNT